MIYELELLHCYHLNIISLLFITLTYIYKPLQMPADSALLKERAVAEILEETKRAAIRAEVWSFLRHVCLIIKVCVYLLQVGGSQAWRKTQKGNVNKRFLNKTVIGTVIQNNIVQKSDSNQKRITAELLKNRPSTNNETVNIQPKSTPSSSSDNSLKSKKIIISQKSRLKAYLQTKKSLPPKGVNVDEGADKNG